jgi:hypothetical protein
VNRNDRSCDVFGVVNDLVYSRHPLSDVHTRDTCKMKSFKSHLCCRLTYTLGSKGADGFSRLYDTLVYFFYVDSEKQPQLNVCDSMEGIL